MNASWQSMGWQEIVVAALCLAAGLYILRAAWLAVAGRNAACCETSCGKCPSSQAKPVLQIEPPPKLPADSPVAR
jgi:hypothetical protein